MRPLSRSRDAEQTFRARFSSGVAKLTAMSLFNFDWAERFRLNFTDK